ncbi:MAG: hypothetical protein JW881_01275 [Spirochaetales bacterium]|nr:hypothetical protein [Spirochaetales bacterium]
MENLFICKTCGHISFGGAPDACPVCKTPGSGFTQKNEAIAPPDKEGHEKHLPVLAVSNTCGLLDGCKDINIKIGETTHPMKKEHWINWIDVYVNGNFASRYIMYPDNLMPALGVHFKDDVSGTVTVIEYCNVHGYWKSETTL